VQKPHPPIVVGGTSELALKRAVRYGDGWYGIARSMDEARDLIGRLRGLERNANRPRSVEVTLSLRTGHPLTADEVRELRDSGVERTLAGLPLRALEGDEVQRFRDEIMAKI
jgi:alkanesulfonate monooxygenase SsuD/methylene tetrahydromethanopterin reductase-like flavin-dependent oxidoreductase (luciferase family)